MLFLWMVENCFITPKSKSQKREGEIGKNPRTQNPSSKLPPRKEDTKKVLQSEM